MTVSTLLAFVLGAAGVAALVLAAPGARWSDAMDRLSSRIRADAAATPAVRDGRQAAPLPARTPGTALAAPEGPRDALDRTIDRFIELLRTAIRTRSLPRRVLVVLGVLLVALAVLLFSLSSTGGGSDGEDLPASHRPPPSLVAA